MAGTSFAHFLALACFQFLKSDLMRLKMPYGEGGSATSLKLKEFAADDRNFNQPIIFEVSVSSELFTSGRFKWQTN